MDTVYRHSKKPCPFCTASCYKKMDKNIRYYWILSGIPGQRRQRGWPALQLLDTCQPTRPEVRASIILFQVNSTSQHLWTYYCYGLRLQNWYMRGVLESRCERYNSYSWANDKFNIPLPPPSPLQVCGKFCCYFFNVSVYENLNVQFYIASRA